MGFRDSTVELPALLMVPDLLPGGGPLNGRRWAGQQLIQLWMRLAAGQTLPLLVSDPAIAQKVHELIRSWGGSNPCQAIAFTSASEVISQGSLLVPDPSIGLWSLWRDALAAPASFSLLGQIHTLCTTGAMTRLEELTAENVFPWDALICSSTAGRAVVESVLGQREERQASRAGVPVQALRQHRPQLPVIPLPMPVQALQQSLPSREAARSALALPADADVLLWLGRLTLHSKTDPAPTYRMLDALAQGRDRPLVLVELGPDDGAEDAAALAALRNCFRHLRFRRLGDAAPVPESVKHQALAAADLGLSLVDNLQETFGQSVVEMMAAGLPVVVSDWDGYRDLVQQGCQGFRVSSRWAEVAQSLSVSMGWLHRIGLYSYPAVAGSLAQLVQLDLEEAQACVSILLDHAPLRRQMGATAARWAREQFDCDVVAAHYRLLLKELSERRALAPAHWRQRASAPLPLDPVRCFQPFASEEGVAAAAQPVQAVESSLKQALQARRSSLWQLLSANLPEDQQPLLRQAVQQKHGVRLFES